MARLSEVAWAVTLRWIVRRRHVEASCITNPSLLGLMLGLVHRSADERVVLTSAVGMARFESATPGSAGSRWSWDSIREVWKPSANSSASSEMSSNMASVNL